MRNTPEKINPIETPLNALSRKIVEGPFNVFGDALWKPGERPAWFGINCIDASRALRGLVNGPERARTRTFQDDSRNHCVTTVTIDGREIFFDPTCGLASGVALDDVAVAPGGALSIPVAPIIEGQASKYLLDLKDRDLCIVLSRADRPPEQPIAYRFDLSESSSLLRYDDPRMQEVVAQRPKFYMRTNTPDGIMQFIMSTGEKRYDVMRIRKNAAEPVYSNKDASAFNELFEEFAAAIRADVDTVMQGITVFLDRLYQLKTSVTRS